MQDLIPPTCTAMLASAIRLSVRVAVGLLVVSISAPATTHAAPTPVPTFLPQRTAGGPASPTVPRSPAVPVASPRPAQRPTTSASPTPTLTAVGATPTRTPTATPTTAPTPTIAPAEDQPTDTGNDSADIEAPVDWQAFVPTDTADHLATMDRAARDSGCGVPWQLLAAIARVESDFGRNMATSSAGAIGYGQFLPSSWRAFGNDGNVYDYRAALPAIATYLCQSGLARDPRAALFAYNHADWYVDLVLDLAVRYDRMAPGAPVPEVLALNPGEDQSIPMHYAPGRDVRLQARARSLDRQVTWLGVPWSGRPPGSSVSASSLETTTLAMLRAEFGLTGDPPQPTQAQSDRLGSLVERAWASGLFANPSPFGEAWSVAEIHQRLERGQSVVVLLNSRQLPGHPPTEAADMGDQPVLVIGATPDRLIYNDPSFSSSLGYGLEVDDATFLDAWQTAATPLQALSISTRPEPPLRDEHGRAAWSPPVIARVVPTPAPPPSPVPTPVVEPTLPPPDPAAADVQTITPEAPPESPPAATGDYPDRSWMLLAGAAFFLATALALRRLRP